MTFERLWVLLLLLLPVLWVAWQWSRCGRRAGLLLKALALAAVILALAEPKLSVWETKMAVTVMVDTSASVSPEDLARASRLAQEIETSRGRHLVRVMPFAAKVRRPAAVEHERQWKLQATEGPEGRATNLEAAVLDAVASLPTDLVPKIVLISDGKENRGSAARVAWQARELGVPVDTYLLAGRPKPELRLDAVSFPALTFAGERFPIELTVESPREAEGTVTVTAEGQTLGASPVHLKTGRNYLRVHASLNAGGAFDLTGSLQTGQLGEIRFAQAVTVRKPKLLYISKDPPGTETHLLQALGSAQFEIEKKDRIPEDGLDAFQVIVLNNWDLEAEEAKIKGELERVVREGTGLLVIGGERNMYVDERKKEEDPLDRVLPAKLVPPRSPEGTCVVLIVDKSSSMEGKKMELARLAAIGVIENLRPVDRVGVLIFDNSFQWAVPIRKAEDRTLIKRLVSGITPDGGTQIAPALAEAYRQVLPVNATFKHIVLLTDGISEEGDSMALAREAAGQRVTISTVGLGQDVNKAYLEKVASFAKGKAYFLSDPSGLAQILLRDVMEHTGQTAVEKPVTPVVVQKAEILEGIDMDGAPPLKGYVKFEAKRTAETILKIEPEDPLLVRWQYGLGRAAVFTSDAKSRWAEAWVSWKAFDRFWTNLTRDLLPHSAPGEATVTYDRANGELVIQYHLARHLVEPDPLPEIYVLGPNGFRKPLEVTKVASGAYEGRIAVGEGQGLFRIRTLEESEVFPETGIYLHEAELNDYGSDELLLRQLAEFTGGRFQPTPSAVFDSGGHAVPSTMRLWPGLLALAILLNLAELFVRKWKGVVEFLRQAWSRRATRLEPGRIISG